MLCSTWLAGCVLNNEPHEKLQLPMWASIGFTFCPPCSLRCFSDWYCTPQNGWPHSIENFIATASISATTTLQASLLGCGTMSPKKQGGDRSEGLGDKDTKKGGLFASWRSTQLGHGRWPRDSAGCRWQILMNRGLTLSQPVFMSQKSRGNICMALKSRRISLTRSNPTRNNKHTQTRKKSNRYYNHTKGKTFI